MKSFFSFFVHRPLLANVITIMVLLLGLGTLPQLNRETFPNVDMGEVIITTRFPYAAPLDVELTVTNKLEKELKSVDGIKDIFSSSVEGVSTIRLVLDSDVDDPDEVKDKIREAIDTVTDLPVEVEERPYVYEVESDAFPILEIGIAGDVGYRELLFHAKKFEKQLENVDGVSGFFKYGYLDREIQIQVDPKKLDTYQVSLLQIIGAIRDRNIRASMGDFNHQQNLPTVLLGDAQFETPDLVGSVVVRSNFNNQLLKVRDLATVMDGFEDETVRSHMNGKSAISFYLLKSPNSDVLRTVDKIRQLSAELSEQLPESISVLESHDFSKYLKNRIQVMMSNGLIGIFFVTGILWFFFNFRTAFWVALGIPVAIMGIFALMPVFGITINIITLLAIILVIGIIVDDGIIVAERIVQHRESGLSPQDAAIKGISEVYKPVLTTVLTTFIAFSPMFFMPGIMGKFIFSIPLVMAFALCISLIEVFVALPAHLLPGLRKLNSDVRPFTQRKINWIRSCRTKYEQLLGSWLNRRYIVVLCFFSVFVLLLLLMVFGMRFVLFPEASAENFMVHIECPVNSTLDVTGSKVRAVESRILDRNLPEIESFTTRIGMYGQYYQEREKKNFATIVVDMTPVSKRKRTAREIVDILREDTADIKGAIIQYEVDSGGPPLGKPIELRVVGDDDQQRLLLAKDIVDYLGTIPGVKDIERNDKAEKDQFQLKFNYEKMAQLGIDVATVTQIVRSAYSGQIATSVRYGDQDVDFKVILNEDLRHQLSVLKNLLIPNQAGRLIRLNDVVRFQKNPGTPNYYHYNNQRSITISGDVDKSKVSVGEVTKKINQYFDPSKWPTMAIVIGGEAQETAESVQSLLVSFLVAVIGIYFLLILLFNSVVQPFIVICMIPFGIMGVIVAFALHRMDMGFLSMIGTVGLSGVVVNDALVMVHHLNALRQNRNGRELHELVVVGAGDRFRPVILTSLTTVVGLLPLAYGWGGSDPFLAPMALALGYGILFATPLTLICLPCLYLIFADIRGQLEQRGLLQPREDT